MLRDTHSDIACESSSGQPRSDWASGLRACLIWGVPIAVLLSTQSIAERYLVILWPLLLSFMGIACLVNARRCGRVHCYVTGPFFLLLAGIALLYGLGVIPLGPHGWSDLSLVLVVGAIALTGAPELLLGRYRTRS